MNNEISRREMLKAVGMAIAGSMIGLNYSCFSPQKSEDVQRGKNFLSKPFRICLNTSTIRAYSLPVDEQVKLCAEAGFDGIELWVSEVDAYIEKGGDYATLRKIIDDSNLKLENMIAFSTWAADDPIKREEGIKTMRHNMEVSASLGSQFVAAPVQGVDKFIPEMMPEYSNRFLRILEMGDEYGVTPLLELWGAGVINTLDKATAMAMGTGHPKASLLLDFYRNFGGEHVSRIVTLVKGAAQGAGLGFYLALEQLAALIHNGNGLFKIYHLLAQRECELRIVATGDGYGVAIYLGAYLFSARQLVGGS